MAEVSITIAVPDTPTITVRILQYDFSLNTATVTFKRDASIAQVQHVIAQRIHLDAVLPSNVVVFVRAGLMKGQPPLHVADGHVTVPPGYCIACPDWKLQDCVNDPFDFHTSSFSLSPTRHPSLLPKRSTSAVPEDLERRLLRRSKSALFLQSVMQLAVAESETHGRQSTIGGPPSITVGGSDQDMDVVDLYYDVLPYAKIFDVDNYKLVMYPASERREVVDKTCAILMFETFSR